MKNTDIPSGVGFRPIVSGDEKLINEFFDSMGGESRAMFNRRDFNRRNALKYCSHPEDETRRYWIAELDGKMIGYLFFLDFNTSIPALGLAIRDELRGRHLGRALVDFAIRTKRVGQGRDPADHPRGKRPRSVSLRGYGLYSCGLLQKRYRILLSLQISNLTWTRFDIYRPKNSSDR